MKKRTLLFLCLTLVSGASAQAQNVGIGTITPDASAQLEVASINKGLLPPRMTTVQCDAISSPAVGRPGLTWILFQTNVLYARTS